MSFFKYLPAVALFLLLFIPQVIAKVVPEGRTIEVTTEVPINTTTCQNGDHIFATLRNSFYDDSELIFPQGSKVEGSIVLLKKPTEGENAEVKVHFTSLTTPSGKKIPISAVIETDEGNGIVYGHGMSKKARFGKMALGIGAKTGTTMAKSALYTATVPKDIRNAIKYGKTAGAGVDIAKTAKSGDIKGATIKTGEQVVKYTPYNDIYKYGKAIKKGIGSAKSINEKEGVGYDVQIKQGAKLELILLQQVTI